MTARQTRILDTLRRLARQRGRVPFSAVRTRPGCSPNTMKAAFGDLACRAGQPVYAYIWSKAGLVYEEHTGRKPNDYWKDRDTRISKIREAVRRFAARRGISEREAFYLVTKTDLEREGVWPAILAYYRGSPELALRDAFGVMRRSVQHEFDSWAATVRHLRKTLKGRDCESLSERLFMQEVPGAVAILKKWGGFVKVMDRSGLRPFDAFAHIAPSGYWTRKSNRVRWVRLLVERHRRRTGDSGALPNSMDFERANLAGLIASTGMTHTALLREAGFDALEPPDWSPKANRIRCVREAVRSLGGPEFVSLTALIQKAPGLVDHYSSKLPRRSARGNTPLLYEILKEAGYARSVEDCEGRFGGMRWTRSSHGHDNHSRCQALADEWIFDLVGARHLHDVIYPGQAGKGRHLNCDFVLLPPPGGGKAKGLWIEFAGLAGARGAVGRDYRRDLRRKAALAKAANLTWLSLTPRQFGTDPARLRRRIVARAPWLTPRLEAARSGRAWKNLCRLPSPGDFVFAVRNKKYSDEKLLGLLRNRVRRFRRNPRAFPLNVGACQQDPRFRGVMIAISRRSNTRDRDWWIDWLCRAGLKRPFAERVGRLRVHHDQSQKAVLGQLMDAYRDARRSGWPVHRAPRLNGALVLRAIRAFGDIRRARAIARREMIRHAAP